MQGQSIEYAYNSRGLESITHQNGNNIHLEYQNERIIRAIGPGGKKIDYEYDENHQLHSVADQLGMIAFYGYDSEKNLNAIYDAKKRPIFEAYYDNYHRAISVTNGKTVWNKQYSLKDHAAQTEGPNQMKMFNQYDGLSSSRIEGFLVGRNIELFLAKTASFSLCSRRITLAMKLRYGYDIQGNVCSAKNSQGIEWRFWYDGANRLVASVDGRGRAEIYFYDEKGRLKSFFPYSFITSEDPISNQTSFHYTGILGG